MSVVETVGKTVDEAIEQALTELNVGREQVDVEILEAPSKAFLGFLGGKPARVKVTVRKIDPVNVAIQFLQEIVNRMDLQVTIENQSTEEQVLLNLRGNDLGILIGKHGQTLDALQYLTNLAAGRDVEEKVRITLDVEDYRRRRTETLSRLALRLADKVKRRREKVVLEPMTPHERKVIHMTLQEDSQIVTYSEGDEPYRKVIIALKK